MQLQFGMGCQLDCVVMVVVVVVGCDAGINATSCWPQHLHPVASDVTRHPRVDTPPLPRSIPSSSSPSLSSPSTFPRQLLDLLLSRRGHRPGSQTLLASSSVSRRQSVAAPPRSLKIPS
jgi:hypothetical protein